MSNPKPRILVVDDDRSICKLMGSILEMESYPFRVAMSGEQARQAMDEERFDILVSDIYLGDDSGLHLLERMKSANSDAEVVIMTAQGSMETAVHAVQNGAFDYISKPFVIDEVLGILHRIEEKFRMVRGATLGSELAESMPVQSGRIRELAGCIVYHENDFVARRPGHAATGHHCDGRECVVCV